MGALSLARDMTHADMAPALALQQLAFQWPHGPLFTGLDWQVPAGAALVQGGPGSGKTTLLRLLAGALLPTSGHILLHGAPLEPEQIFWPEREAAGSDPLVVRDWWRALAQRYPGWNGAALEQHVQGFSLVEHQSKAFFMLSTGTRRKAWLAAALASGAPLALIDEPLAGLDLASSRYLTSAIAAATQHSGRVIVVAHYAPLDGVPWAADLLLHDAP